MNNQTESSKQPNYRIYDRTGGGVTEDIYAESLEDAITAPTGTIEKIKAAPTKQEVDALVSHAITSRKHSDSALRLISRAAYNRAQELAKP